MSEKGKYLFIFTISDVQSFIEKARKTQDLYAGSRILSELIQEGIKEFENQFRDFNPEIIFPQFDRNDKEASLPNRFIAKIEKNTEGGIDLVHKIRNEQKLGVEDMVKAKFAIMAQTALGTHQPPNGFNEQIAAHLDIHWAFEKMIGTYDEAYRNLEITLGAVKNVRSFQQYDYAFRRNGYGEKGRKCSLDGENNALFYKKRQENEKKLAYLYNGVGISDFAFSENEGLSAVSFVKRFHEWKNNEGSKVKFPSTAEIALMNDESKLSEKTKKILECYKKLFDRKKIGEGCIEMLTNGYISNCNIRDFSERDWNEHFDYQFLYEENLTEKNLPDDIQYNLVKTLHKELKKSFSQKYYALILFDGDKMGKWLSGEYLKPEWKSTKLEEFHSKLSGLLSTFGREAKNLLNKENQNGATVYAGGDDFLGFVNLECLFDVMSQLRAKFKEQVSDKLSIYTDEELTFSAGIVIAHYKEPLAVVLQKAREVEKIAKNNADRNAFAVAVLKSSGEIQQATFKWEKDSWGAIETIVKGLKTEQFSNKFITNITQTLYDLAGIELKEIDKFVDTRTYPLGIETAILYEIKRLLDRAKNPQKFKTKTEETAILNTFSDAIDRLWHIWKKDEKEIKLISRVENFIYALHIADFIHRQLKNN